MSIKGGCDFGGHGPNRPLFRPRRESWCWVRAAGQNVNYFNFLQDTEKLEAGAAPTCQSRSYVSSIAKSLQIRRKYRLLLQIACSCFLCHYLFRHASLQTRRWLIRVHQRFSGTVQAICGLQIPHIRTSLAAIRLNCRKGPLRPLMPTLVVPASKRQAHHHVAWKVSIQCRITN